MKPTRYPFLAAACLAVQFLTLAAAPAIQAQTSTLGLTVTANPSPAKPGETVNYTFTIINKTNVATGYVEVDWKVPNYATNDTPGTSRAQNYLNLAPGQSYTFNAAYTIDTGSVTAGRAAPADGSLMVVTTNSYLQGTNNSGATAAAQAVIDSTPTLSVGIADDTGGSAAPSQTVTYTLTATNRGTAAVTSTVLSAPVPTGTTFVTASDGGTLSGGVVQWSVGALAPGAVVSRRYSAQMGSSVGLVLATAQATDQANGNNQAATSLTTVVRALPLLGFTVTANPNPAKPGETVNYTYTISNPGTVATGYLEVDWTVPNFVTNDTPGTVRGDNYLNLAPGQSYTFNKAYTVDVGSVSSGRPVPADGSVLRLEATAFLQGGNRYGATASAEAVIDSTPTLSVGIADDTDGSAAPSQTVTYTLTATNRGTAAAANTVLSAPLPFGTTFVSASDAGAVSGGAVQWNLGALAPGAVVSRRYAVQVSTAVSLVLARGEAIDAGVLTNRAATTMPTTVRALPLLGFTVTANPNPAKPGETVNFTYTISNPSNVATAYLEVDWTVPNFVTNDTPGTVRGDNYLNLAPGQSYSFSKAYVLGNSLVDGTVLRMDATAFLQGGNHYGATAAAEVVVDNSPSLTLGIADDTDGSAASGQTVTYTLTATNRGAATVANSVLKLPVPNGTSVVGAGDAGVINDGAVQWNVGALAPGVATTRLVALSMGSNAVGSTVPIKAEIAEAGGLTDRAVGTMATTVRSTPLIGLTVTVDQAVAKPGQVVNYTFTLTNLGNTAFESSYAEVDWTVPNFVSSDTPGTVRGNNYLSVAPGQSYSFSQAYTVDAGSVSAGRAAPTDGSVLRLEATAFAQGGNRYGATASASVVVHSVQAPAVGVGGGTVSAQVGQAFSYQVQASNAPTTYTAGGLPSGLNINTATGLITGTPTVSGSFNVVLGATNEGGTGSATLTINVIPASPTITVTGGTVSGQVGQPLSYQIQASNLPATFTASGLPGGLGVNAATGLISGVPTVAGTFNVTIAATNPGGTGTTTLTFNIVPALPTVTLSAYVPEVTAGTGQVGSFLLTRTGDLSQDLIVSYVVKGSALNGYDYVYLKGFAKIKAGKSTKQIKITPYGYGRGPGVRVVVRLVLAASDDYIVGTASTEKIKVKIDGQ